MKNFLQVFAADTAEVLTYHQVSISKSHPKEGWVEQDPLEILSAVDECMNQTVQNLRRLTIDPADIVAIGIANQRETTIVWDLVTGEPLYNAIGNVIIFSQKFIFKLTQLIMLRLLHCNFKSLLIKKIEPLRYEITGKSSIIPIENIKMEIHLVLHWNVNSENTFIDEEGHAIERQLLRGYQSEAS